MRRGNGGDGGVLWRWRGELGNMEFEAAVMCWGGGGGLMACELERDRGGLVGEKTS